MSSYELNSTAKANEALAAIGGTGFGSNSIQLLKQLVVAAGVYRSNQFVGPLDAFTAGLAGTWSVARRLLTSYEGALIRVRRSNDNAEQDIGYTSAGELDAAALASFVGSNSAFVRTVYDQSGNARNFAQTTAAIQPRIVNAGTLEDGARFLGGQYMDIASGAASQYSNGTQTQVVVKGIATAAGGRMFDFGSDALSAWMPLSSSVFWDAPFPSGRISASTPSGVLDLLKVMSFEREDSTSRVRFDGTVGLSGSVSGSITGTTAFRIGATLAASGAWTGRIKDIAIWSTCVTPAERANALL